VESITRTECEYCGLLVGECPQSAEHARLHSENETTWRRLAERRMVTAVLAPDAEVADVSAG
jgi:hypothetical protein